MAETAYDLDELTRGVQEKLELHLRDHLNGPCQCGEIGNHDPESIDMCDDLTKLIAELTYETIPERPVWSPEFYQQHSEHWEGEPPGEAPQDLDRLRELLVNKLEGQICQWVDGWYLAEAAKREQEVIHEVCREIGNQLSALIVVSLNVRSEGKIAVGRTREQLEDIGRRLEIEGRKLTGTFQLDLPDL